MTDRASMDDSHNDRCELCGYLRKHHPAVVDVNHNTVIWLCLTVPTFKKLGQKAVKKAATVHDSQPKEEQR